MKESAFRDKTCDKRGKRTDCYPGREFYKGIPIGKRARPFWQGFLHCTCIHSPWKIQAVYVLIRNCMFSISKQYIFPIRNDIIVLDFDMNLFTLLSFLFFRYILPQLLYAMQTLEVFNILEHTLTPGKIRKEARIKKQIFQTWLKCQR